MRTESAKIKGLLSILLIGTLLLPGCKKEEPKQDGKAALKAPQVRKAEGEAKPGEAKPAEIKVEAETYIYDPGGRRDPFLSIIEAAKKDRETEKKKKGLKPTEAYEVGAVRVIAIANDRRNRYAMIQFPDNKYVTVKEGTSLGLYGGKVVKITQEGVVVRELTKDYKGVMQPKDIILKLRKEEGE